MTGVVVGGQAIRPLKSSESAIEGDDLSSIVVAGQHVELSLTAVTPHTLRVSILPVLADGSLEPFEDDLVLVRNEWPPPTLELLAKRQGAMFAWYDRDVRVSFDPVAIEIRDRVGKLIQRLQIESDTSAVTFFCGDAPLFGLGEGNHQFNRRGALYPMEHGQGGPQFPELGGRMPVPWLASPEGWAIFWHRPLGRFDLTKQEGWFEARDRDRRLPLDIFIMVGSPKELYGELGALIGFPHIPPLWALGYLQSHRTLASREEVLSEAKTFREKKLPCDALIFLGTGFCPSGWNTGHGSFSFNPDVFPDPPRVIQELHGEGFKVVLHVVPKVRDLHGSVEDSGPAAEEPQSASETWQDHVRIFRLGVDGWWPDEGDWLSESACLVRNRMYWDGCLRERPNVRPFALHRNGYAGIERYGWLWSGDIDSSWEALAAQVAVGINTGLSGMPFWGTDTGGFVTTPELTGELFVRWFQFSAFCPLFRSHGRTWKLRLPWGWNTGDYGPQELGGYRGKAGLPDPKELHNAQVEPICRKYLELRYRLMPYTYSAFREAHDTGLPIMRALWLHYPEDRHAAERGDEYLWGRDILVTPVTEKGAPFRKLYLPRGAWHDFWTSERFEGGGEISRAVDLSTLPLYVRAGTLLPMGPVKQYANERPDETLTILIYPGADGDFALYEDDGVSFDYEQGEFMRLKMLWDDRRRQLSLSLVAGSKMLPPSPRLVEARMAATGETRQILFDGKPAGVRF
jgi:alpha-glucosidase (family GH31 glycosyl hydrolase)